MYLYLRMYNAPHGDGDGVLLGLQGGDDALLVRVEPRLGHQGQERQPRYVPPLPFIEAPFV